MSFFRGRSQPAQAAQLPTYTGLQLPTATSTLPVPLIWGRNKASVNVIFYGGFTPVPELAAGNRGGKGLPGIGGGGGGLQIVGWFYLADLLLAIGEGPIEGIGCVYKGQSVVNFSTMGITLFKGTDSQTPFSYIDTKFPGKGLAYRHTAYLGCPQYNLGESAALGSVNFEILGRYYGSSFNELDADPALIVNDFLTHPICGAQFPPDELSYSDLLGDDGDSSVQTYCQAMGIALSPVLNQFEPANSVLERWLGLMNCAPFVSQGKLRIVPYGDENVTGNGVTWIAPIETVADLTEDHFALLTDDQEPVEISLADPVTLPSVLRAEVLHRGENATPNQYQPQTVEARDMGSIVGNPNRVASADSMHEVCDIQMGAMIVQTKLQRARYLQNSIEFFLDWSWIDLDPMDIVSLTSLRLGFSQKLVRIRKIESDDSGMLKFTAEEFIQGVCTPGPNPSASTISTSGNTAVDAEPVNNVLIYEPPVGYTGPKNGGVPQIWFGATGGMGATADPNWGGCYVHGSLDGGVTYTQIGKIVAAMAHGTLLASVPSVTGWDTTSTVSVDMSSSGQSLETITDDSAQAGGNLTLIDDELVCFATATLAGVNQYAVTRMQRGFYGTTPASHSAGANFAQLDNTLKMNLPTDYIGKAMKFKFQSFNRYGEGLQDLSTCVAFDYTPDGNGNGNMQLSTISETVTLSPGSTFATTTEKIPAGAILLAVKTENLATIVGNVDLTGYSVDPSYEANGTPYTGPVNEFGLQNLVSGNIVNTAVASKQWQVDSTIRLTATGTPSPTFTSGSVKVTLTYLSA
jgi:hypothetical protein